MKKPIINRKELYNSYYCNSRNTPKTEISKIRIGNTIKDEKSGQKLSLSKWVLKMLLESSPANNP
jgi:hypothetical protein